MFITRCRIIELIISLLITMLIFSDNGIIVFNKLGYETYNYKKNYLVLFIIYTIVYWICNIIYKSIKEIKEIKLSEVTKSEILFMFVLIITIFLLFFDDYLPLKLVRYIMLPIVIINIFKNSIRYFNIDKMTLKTTPFYIAIIISALKAIDKESVIRTFKSSFGIYLLPFVMGQYKYNEKIKKLCEYSLLCGFLILLILGYLEKIEFIQGLYFPNRISGGKYIWRYAGLLMYGIVFLMYKLIFLKNTLEEQLINTYGLLIGVIVLILTGNRSTWLAILVCMIFMIIKKYVGLGDIKKGIKFLVITLSIIIVCVFLLKETSYGKRVYSIGNLKTDSSNISRIEIWKESIRMFKENKLIGVGLSHQNFNKNENIENYTYEKNNHNEAHSSYFHILATTGIIGILAFLWMNINFVIELLKKKTEFSNFALSSLLGFSVMGCFVSTIIYKDMLGLLFIIIALALNEKE